MSLWELLLIGAALSMDAVAVSAVSGMALPRLRWSDVWLLAGSFGAFQGLMPLLGYFAGSAAAAYVQTLAEPLAALLLALVGGKMLRDSLRGEAEALAAVSLPLVLLQALATSVDALAVGVGFAALGSVNIWQASALIAGCTGLLCTLALRLGRRCGAWLADKAGVAGGLVLLAIALRLLL